MTEGFFFKMIFTGDIDPGISNTYQFSVAVDAKIHKKFQRIYF